MFEAIDEGIIYEGKKFQEHVKGTIILFEIIWAFFRVFHIQKKKIITNGIVIFCGPYDLFWNCYICNVQHGQNLPTNFG